MLRGFRNPRTRRCRPVCEFAVLAIALPAAVSAAPLQVVLTRIGFPGSRGNFVRNGTWTPVVVDISSVSGEPFDGEVRVARADADGDVTVDRMPVHLDRPPADHVRITLYALAGAASGRDAFPVEIRDDQGRLVQVYAPDPTYQVRPTEGAEPLDIGPDDVLILSVSSQTLGRLRELTDETRGVQYDRIPRVAHLSPADLPELWIGLEAVDHLVWDDARPEELTERQRRALIEWVRQGGHLVIAASRSAPSMRLLPSFDRILPVDVGEVEMVENLPELRRRLLAPSSTEEAPASRRGSEWWRQPYPDPLPVVRCTLRKGAYRIPNAPGYTSDVVTQRSLGRGRVTFCAATLHDLFQPGDSAVSFFETLFHLVPIDPETQPQAYRTTESTRLFPYVAGAVAFIGSGSVYLLTAGIFSLVYVLAATIGIWRILGRRGWRHQSWNAFAVVSLAASALAAAAVNGVRGFGESLRQVSIVDMEAGKTVGTGTVLIGLKTGLDRTMDLWLPDDPKADASPGLTRGFLRPMPASANPLETGGTFTDPVEYRLRPSSAVLEGVRIRGTLKRLEGRWRGPLAGRIEAKIAVKGRTIEEGSYLVNHLGVDLTDCYLLQARVDPYVVPGYRDNWIYAFPIGTLAAGARVDLPGRCYRDWDESKNTLDAYIAQWTLRRAQEAWADRFMSVAIDRRFRRNVDFSIAGQEKNALLLLSTASEFEPRSVQRWGFRQQYALSQDRARSLDLSFRLRRDNMILIGFADDPGPIRLMRRTGEKTFTPLPPDPDASWTMYRIDLPVTVLDADADPLAGEDDKVE
ncbi:MAG: hypothetical protein D6788_03695 [Planctomycetota bacterium]|nr:MAG: hypothetical protein D6788_03695 [Planctomycetota bacterium]